MVGSPAGDGQTTMTDKLDTGEFLFFGAFLNFLPIFLCFYFFFRMRANEGSNLQVQECRKDQIIGT